MVSIKAHNVLDYVLGGVLILSPYVFGFAEVDAARGLFLFLGFGIIAYSLITAYPYSIFKWIPLGWHMGLDVLLGVSLILGAYVFGYNEFMTFGQMVVHYVLGIGAISLVAVTRPKQREIRGTQSAVDIDRRAA